MEQLKSCRYAQDRACIVCIDLQRHERFILMAVLLSCSHHTAAGGLAPPPSRRDAPHRMLIHTKRGDVIIYVPFHTNIYMSTEYSVWRLMLQISAKKLIYV